MKSSNRVISHRPVTQRSGAVVLELILALPILVIAVFAVVEFGLWMSAKEKLEMAARIGAQAASETPAIDTLAALSGSEIQTKVYRYLENAGIDTSNVQLTLTHNVGGGDTLIDPPGGTCPAPALPPAPPDQTVPVNRQYVRLVVCIPTDDITPNMLSYFGFDVSEFHTQHAKTYRYELGGTP